MSTVVSFASFGSFFLPFGVDPVALAFVGWAGSASSLACSSSFSEGSSGCTVLLSSTFPGERSAGFVDFAPSLAGSPCSKIDLSATAFCFLEGAILSEIGASNEQK